jgi:hypothetical protein
MLQDSAAILANQDQGRVVIRLTIRRRTPGPFNGFLGNLYQFRRPWPGCFNFSVVQAYTAPACLN